LLHFREHPALFASFPNPPMPNYDYECEKCGHVFEVFQSMKDPHLTKCPQKGCRGKIHRKLGTGAGFVFKGSGFYITDYRSEGYKEAAKKDVAPAAESKSESKPESKPAAESKPATESKPAKKEKTASKD
jgi:putative FmdB family regulatory protein